MNLGLGICNEVHTSLHISHISSPMVKLCVHPLATSCAIIKLPVWSWQPQGQKTKRQGKRRKLLFLCRTARVQSGIHEPDATCLIYTRAIRTPRHSHTCVYLRCTLNCDLIDDIIFQFEKWKRLCKIMSNSLLVDYCVIPLSFCCSGFAINLISFWRGLKLTNI